MEGFELGNRDKNNDCLLATADINLPGSRNLQRAEFGLEIRDVVFEIKQCLSDLYFGLIRRSVRCIGSAEDFVLERHVENWEENG